MTNDPPEVRPAGGEIDAAIHKLIGGERNRPFAYSSDIAEAWKVVRWMRKKGPGLFALRQQDGFGNWECEWGSGASQVKAPTPELAICRAALKGWR